MTKHEMGTKSAAVRDDVRVIRKARSAGAEANLRDYDEAVASFSWKSARAALDGLPGGALNIAHEAVDRHASGALAGKVALRCLSRAGGSTNLSYAELGS